MLFFTAVMFDWPLMMIFSSLLLLVTGGMAATGRFSTTPDDAPPTEAQISSVDDAQEMRQARNNLDRLDAIPDRPTLPPYEYTPLPQSADVYTYTPEDYREIARYARSREPDTRPPAWRTGPEEFPLDALDKLGKPPRPPMPSHAITAAENAECDYQNSGALTVDLGLLVYSGDSDKPAVYREAPVPDNARYIQPFAEVWFEEPLKGGSVRLMLLDPDGALRFVSGAAFDRDDAKGSGRHTVLSPTRLPIGDHLPVHQDGWRLRVEVRGRCIADHVVNWYKPGSANALVEHMATDGELTVDLAALVEQVALTPLSLDELLNGDDDASHDVR